MKNGQTRQSATFSGRDALAYSQRVAGEEAASKQHVQKRRRADKGLEVVFNPGAHKSYVTGFHKRKVQRRKEAEAKIAAKEKQQRLEDRKVRRDERAKKLELDRYPLPPDPEEVKAAREGASSRVPIAVDMFDQDGVTTTVTTIALHSDDDQPFASSSGDSDSDSEAEEQQHQLRIGGDGGGATLNGSRNQLADDGFPAVAGLDPGDADGTATSPTPNSDETPTTSRRTAEAAPASALVRDRGIVLRPPPGAKRKKKKELAKKAREQRAKRTREALLGAKGGSSKKGSGGISKKHGNKGGNAERAERKKGGGKGR